MRSERLRKAQAALKRHDMAAALFVRPENMRYTIAVKGHAFCPAAQLCPRFRQSTIPFSTSSATWSSIRKCIVPGSSRRTSVSPIRWLEFHLRAGGSEREAKRFAAAIAAELKAKGVFGERIGVDALDEPGRAGVARGRGRAGRCQAGDHGGAPLQDAGRGCLHRDRDRHLQQRLYELHEFQAGDARARRRRRHA